MIDGAGLWGNAAKERPGPCHGQGVASRARGHAMGRGPLCPVSCKTIDARHHDLPLLPQPRFGVLPLIGGRGSEPGRWRRCWTCQRQWIGCCWQSGRRIGPDAGLGPVLHRPERPRLEPSQVRPSSRGPDPGKRRRTMRHFPAAASLLQIAASISSPSGGDRPAALPGLPFGGFGQRRSAGGWHPIPTAQLASAAPLRGRKGSLLLAQGVEATRMNRHGELLAKICAESTA
jgi:hypothetical protein